MSEASTSEILHQLQTNDKAVLKALFEKHYKDVCCTIHRLVADRDQVEDLAQEIFIRLWQKRFDLQINISFGAYLHRMAINEAISFLRKTKRQQDKLEALQTTPLPSAYDHFDGEELFIQQELKDQVTAAIDALPPRCRAIFQLSRFEQLSYQEIADRLDLSIKTVEHQMGKALRLLRIALGHHFSLVLWLYFF